jgi:superfamily II DNA or RNA helicase
MDGKSILEYFDNRIAAEIRLPEAIERKLLCPFQYFGVTDNEYSDTLVHAFRKFSAALSG